MFLSGNNSVRIDIVIVVSFTTKRHCPRHRVCREDYEEDREE